LKTIKNISKFIIGLGISTILLYIIFGKEASSWEEIKNEIQKCNYNFIALSILFGVLALISRAMRWRILIKSLGYKSSLKKSFTAVAIGYFSNMIIPRIGEITRCSSMKKMTKAPFDKLFGTIILERIIDLLMILVLTLVVLITHKNLFVKFLEIGTNKINIQSENKIIYVLTFIIILFGITFFLYKKFSPKMKKFISGIKSGILSVQIMKEKYLFITHTIFIWFMYFMMTYICFFAFDKTTILNIKDGLYTMVIGGYGMMLPSLGGTGTYHTLVGSGLGLLKIDPNIANAFTLILHGAQSIMTISAGIIGIIFFLYIKNK
tara:strand:- start:159 stop:1121 length:963 start_codon:yes stop_codon:yes gene_type:complete